MNADFRRATAALVAAVGGFALFLWSWNTLAGLLGFPGAEARHAFAALVLLGTLRFVLTGHGRCRPDHRVRRHDHRLR